MQEVTFECINQLYRFQIITVSAGVDYRPLRRNVTLSGTVASENLGVTIIEDEITERTESFGARIIIPQDAQRLGVRLGDQSNMTINILDDDRKTNYGI